MERWAEIGRTYFGEQLSIREIARRSGHDRKAVRRPLRSEVPQRYSRPAREKLRG